MSTTKNPTSAVELNEVVMGDDSSKAEEKEEKKLEYHESTDFVSALKKKSIPESDLVKSHKVEDTMASRELAISKMKLNLSKIFHHWDIDHSEYVDLREIQLGLYVVGEIVPRETILYHMKKVSGRKTAVDKCYARDFPDLIVALSDGTIEGLQDLTFRLSKNIPVKDKARPSLWLRLVGASGKFGESKTKNQNADEMQGGMSRVKRSMSTIDGIANIAGHLGDNIHFWRPKIMWEMLTFQRGVYVTVFVVYHFHITRIPTLKHHTQVRRIFHVSSLAIRFQSFLLSVQQISIRSCILLLRTGRTECWIRCVE